MTGDERLSRVLGRVLLVGAWTGVLAACLAIGFQVASTGRIQGPWSFTLLPRLEDPWPALMAWSGMALLILTPVVSLGILGASLAVRRRLSPLITAVVLLLVLALGLALGLVEAHH